MACRNLRGRCGTWFALVIAIVVLQAAGHSQHINMRGEDPLNTYSSGQSVVPIFGGWIPNADGTFELMFSYLNRNLQEEIDVPIGPDNTISAPYGPDAGQPTHFLPRNNRWQFAIHVPADFGSKEVVWTLASHGETLHAYASLKPGYVIDEFAIQHEYSADSTHGRVAPTLQVEGGKERAVKVGQPMPLVATATDPNPASKRRRAAPSYPAVVGPGAVGGTGTRDSPPGLRFSWYVYRGDAKQVMFNPRMPFKVWEDLRGGSPWSPGWQPPPIPADNTWRHTVTFKEPGTYMLRALAHNGTHFKYENVTFTVTP
jgi:hypothetical protein